MCKSLALLFIVSAFWACSSEHSEPAVCTAGTQGCACDSGTCETGLVCLSARCVGVDGDTEADTYDADKEEDAGEGELLEETDTKESDETEAVDGDAEREEEAGEEEEELEATVPLAPWFECGTTDVPAQATVVTAFSLADHYFAGDAGNFRQIDKTVEFPTAGTWKSVLMKTELFCPADGKCDYWDRYANVFLVKNPGPQEERFELARYITPFRTGLCMLTDVTDFAGHLSGQQTLRSFIDTWVGPDSSYGHGWRVSITFIFLAGQAAPNETLSNLWSYYGPEIGNPANPVSAQVPDKRLTLPAQTKRARLRLIGTGHGQGNQDNCGEFCALNLVVAVNGQSFTVNPWRGDCGQNPLGSKQAGSWKYSRNGFCPGAAVVPALVDVSQAVKAGQENTFSFHIQTPSGSVYENGCRPGNGGDSNTCQGCVFESGAGNCDYNSGNHTMPNVQLSVQLITSE